MITIDYLIMNLTGAWSPNSHPDFMSQDENPFTFERHEYGTKAFKNVFTLFYYSEKLGTLSASPRSSVIPAELSQLQIENILFYTYSGEKLRFIISKLTDLFNIKFTSINRLDIAHDSTELKEKIDAVKTGVFHENSLKISGREKPVTPYFISNNGELKFTGLSIGKRSASRFLRIYDKTLEMAKDNLKPYIKDWHASLGYAPDAQIWRFEYQLNNSFFRTLKKDSHLDVVWEIFDIKYLVELIQKAEKNHFEICHNTGKIETNKEAKFILIDWQKVAKSLKVKIQDRLKRIYKPFQVSINLQKRLAKSLLREIYLNKGNHLYYTLINTLKQYDLIDWFYEKKAFYFSEFRNKENYKNHFNEVDFINHFNQGIKEYAV